MTARRSQAAKPYLVRPVALGGALSGVDLDKALALAHAIEDQELASRMQRNPMIAGGRPARLRAAAGPIRRAGDACRPSACDSWEQAPRA